MALTSRDSFNTMVNELVDSFPNNVDGRTSISDFGKLLFNEGQTTGTEKLLPKGLGVKRELNNNEPASNHISANSTDVNNLAANFANSPAANFANSPAANFAKNPAANNPTANNPAANFVNNSVANNYVAHNHAANNSHNHAANNAHNNLAANNAHNNHAANNAHNHAAINAHNNAANNAHINAQNTGSKSPGNGIYVNNNASYRTGTGAKFVSSPSGVMHLQIDEAVLNATQGVKKKGKSAPKRWSKEEDNALRVAVRNHGEKNWKSIALEVEGRNHTQCLQRWTKVLAPGLVKGHWRPDEDDLLKQLVAEGRKNWGQVASRIPGRTSKQCRERWYNHLDPNIIRGEYTKEEDQIILSAQAQLGNRWSAISHMVPGRTEDAVKIRWKSLCRAQNSKNKQSVSLADKAKKAQLEMQRAQFQNTQMMMQQQAMVNTANMYYAPNMAMNHAYVPYNHNVKQRAHSAQYYNPTHAAEFGFNPAASFASSLGQIAPSNNQASHHVPPAMYNNAQVRPKSTTANPAHVPSNDKIKEEQLNRIPRPSMDAARAAIARRARQSESGRSSIEGFLNALGDVGRISDMDLSDLANVGDEVWRMSGDMNRLSI